MTDTIPRVVEPGWQHADEVGDGLAVLRYPDGTVRFEHLCDRTARDRGVIICAPALRIGPHGPGHQLVSVDPVTISPSILCPDCGTHGFVTDGKWVAA